MKLWKKILLTLLLVFAAGFLFLIRRPSGLVNSADEIKWGVAFSKPFSTEMGLDWRENYLAMMEDLGVKSIRLPLYWPDIEKEPGQYDFSSYDWMISEAQKRNVELILVVGRKLPRWPECHAPFWADKLTETKKQEKILQYITTSVERYRDRDNISLWQVDNEPFLGFGECTTTPAEFLDKEIKVVRNLDPERKILVTDSGELSLWVFAAGRGDIFGTTMYRVIYSTKVGGYYKYPLPPRFFWLKANIVHLFYPNKPIINTELQAEPWGPKLIYDLPLGEQEKSMSLSQFNENIEYAKQTGFPEVYLWGVEWWYWLKTKHANPDFWEAAKRVINSNQN
jgi:hypothetical protein